MSNLPPVSNGSETHGAGETPSRNVSEPKIYNECDRIVILTPCYDRQSTTDYNESLTLCKQVPSARFRMADGSVQVLPVVAASIWFSNESHIDRGRNSLLFQFEQKHYRFGLWLDADQPFEPEHIASLWRHLVNGVRVVCGLVALKSIVPTFVCNTIKGEKPDPITGLMRIKDGGTGCMAFNRDILPEIRDRWPALVRKTLAGAMKADENSEEIHLAIRALAHLGLSADISFTGNPNTVCAGRTSYAYFASGVTWRDGRGDWLSEDWMLCHRCALLGIPIYADVTVNLKHLGRQLFPPPPEELIEAALRVTSGNNPPFPKHLADDARQALQRLYSDISDQSITVLHATRGRPEKALKAKQAWLERSSGPVQYVFAVDSDDAESIRAVSDHPHVIVPTSGGIVLAINEAAKKATGKILVMAADDCTPPQGWDSSIRDCFRGQIGDPRVLMTSDGYSNQELIPHPIMTRAFYEQNGYFFCPEYTHLFCDTELTVRAGAAGQIIDARHLVFKHDHPMFTKESPDALHIERNSPEAWKSGKSTFNRRNPNSNHAHAQ